MEPYRVTIQGRTFEVPRASVGSQQEAEAAVRQHLAAQPVQQTRSGPTATKAKDVLAGLAQGATLGASDEIFGRLGSFVRNVPAQQTIEQRRADVQQAQQRSPFGFFGSELLGSAGTGLGLFAATRGKKGSQFLPQAIANNPYAKATAIGGAEGAVAGFNVGEGDAAQRAPGALAGGVLGAGLGAGSQFVAPKVSDAAVQLAEKYGLPLSPESLGKGAKALTQAARQVPFVGGQFRKRGEDTLDQFNTATVNQILKPIGRQLGEVKAGQDAYKAAKSEVKAAYNELLNGVEEVDLGETLQDMLADQLDKIDVGEKTAKKLQKQIAALDTMMGGQVVDGKRFKEIDSKLRQMIDAYDAQGKAPDAAKQLRGKEIAAVLRTIKARLRSSIGDAAGGDFATALQNTDFSFKLLKMLEDLSKKANTEDRFTPKQLQSAIRKKFGKEGDQVAEGTAPLQEMANLADEVLSDLEYSTARDTELMQILNNVAGVVPAVGAAGLGAADAADRELGAMGYGAGALGLLSLLTRPGVYRQIAPAAVRGGTRASQATQILTPAAALQAGKLFSNEGE